MLLAIEPYLFIISTITLLELEILGMVAIDAKINVNGKINTNAKNWYGSQNQYRYQNQY